MPNYIIRSYNLRFLTPAFLGDAGQNGAWRTPPIKAALRQWWRLAYAAGRHPDERSVSRFVSTMRQHERLLFGVAADKDEGSQRSLVRIRLNRWDEGKLKSWKDPKNPKLDLDHPKVIHPNVDRRGSIGAHLYLGYGPLRAEAGGGTGLKKNAAIQFDEHAELKLAFPAEPEQQKAIDTALWLMDRYGTLGGRSRNGWGSFSLTPANGTPQFADSLIDGLTREWTQALTLDWPHAIGAMDGAPLIWETEPMQDWKAIMKRLAELKIGLRTKFEFTTGKSSERVESRHWLSYPVTNHSIKDWGDARLPNSLRFKVRRGENGKLRGVIFHLPCKPPPVPFKPDVNAIIDVWQKVYAYLDAEPQQLTPVSA